VKAEPKNGELRDRFASALSRQKRLDEAEAEAEYGEVIRLRPKFAGGSERLGVILKWRGSLAGAPPLFREAATLDPDHGDA
jgi:Flp pilus assembly protein TadD